MTVPSRIDRPYTLYPIPDTPYTLYRIPAIPYYTVYRLYPIIPYTGYTLLYRIPAIPYYTVYRLYPTLYTLYPIPYTLPRGYSRSTLKAAAFNSRSGPRP
jgi:hypothetical protein